MDYDFYLLGHERYMNSLFVEGGGHLGCLGHVSAVHQPEPGADLENDENDRSESVEMSETYCGGEVDTIIDKVELSAGGDIFPLSSSCST